MTTQFRIIQGKTFAPVVRFGTKPYLYKQIVGITQAAPARFYVPAHGLPDGWPAAPVSVKGMRDINAIGEPPDLAPADYRPITVVDVDHVDINEINASQFQPYESGGYLQCLTPVNLAGCTSRLVIKDAPGGTVLDTLASADSEIAIDNVAKTIIATFSATMTAAYTWTSGYFEWELATGASPSVVYQLLAGIITVETEIAT